MRKSTSLIYRTQRLAELCNGIDGSIQFTVAERLWGRMDDLVSEDNALENIFNALAYEISQVQREVSSF